MRILFAGTPVFAAESLRAILHTQHEVVGVYTQPDRPVGRGRELKPSPVKELALARQLPIFQPASLRDSQAQAELAELDADIMVVAAYGLILPKAVLNTPRLGCINVHGSLLPRWRGAAPIQRAILTGDKETGITIMQMDEGLDTGAMLYKMACPISEHDTSASLHDRLALLGGDALLTVLEAIEHDEPFAPEAQDNQLATYAAKLTKEEGLINWSLSALQISRAIRAFNPWPVCYTTAQGQTIRLWQGHRVHGQQTTAPAGMIIKADKQGLWVAAGDGEVIAIDTLQLPNGKALAFNDVLNSRKELFQVGTSLGRPA
ncbi:methionyl-tRNA formyltransferase [Agitococcus lubricus]|uniref:methionyl-tRNA formyltransferase n=1 Tax=Agitococcus lubricus TaxID=1077255 RepID=UPI001EFCF1A6|nr:methionyl-tRNA formyltransferase [Agitococcus lubricus]